LQATLEKYARMIMNRVGVTSIQLLAGIRLTHVLAPAFRRFCGDWGTRPNGYVKGGFNVEVQQSSGARSNVHSPSSKCPLSLGHQAT